MRQLALSPAQVFNMKTLKEEIWVTRRDLDLPRRAKAVGLVLADYQLARWFLASGWNLAYADGNTVLDSISNTVRWRETKGIWELVTSREKRQKFLPVLERGLFVSGGMGPAGRATMLIQPSAITAVADRDLKLVPDLVLYTLERCRPQSTFPFLPSRRERAPFRTLMF